MSDVSDAPGVHHGGAPAVGPRRHPGLRSHAALHRGHFNTVFSLLPQWGYPHGLLTFVGAGMWIGLMGPMRVTEGNIELPLPPGRLRTLLAVLLLRANQAVSVDRLAAAAWDDRPPAGASVTIRSYVKRLRQALGPELGARILTRYPGYLIEVGEEELDVLRFASLCRAGSTALHARRWQSAFEILSTALELWRGTPLLDVPAPGLQRDEVPPLQDLWLQAIEWRTDAALNLDRYDEVAAELQRVTKEHPLRERLHAQLMLAFAAGGRQAEALAAYRQARRLLLDELGVEPGPGLREAHRRVLRGDVGLAARTNPPGLRRASELGHSRVAEEPNRARVEPPGQALLDLFSRTEDAMIAINSASRVVAWNWAATSLFGHTRDQVLGRCCAEVLGWRDRHGNLVCGPGCGIMVQAAQGLPGGTQQVLAGTSSGRVLWISVSSLVLPSEYHAVCQVVHFIREVTLTPLEEAAVEFVHHEQARQGCCEHSRSANTRHGPC